MAMVNRCGWDGAVGAAAAAAVVVVLGLDLLDGGAETDSVSVSVSESGLLHLGFDFA
jgi:hypothetical protein